MSYEMIKLGDLCDINKRLSKNIENPKYISFVAMQDISELSKSVINEKRRPFSEVSKGYTPFKRGDVLLAKITPCFENGKVAIANIKNEIGFGSSEFHTFTPTNSEKMSNKYLYYFFQLPYFIKDATRNMTGSAGQKRVPKRYLEKVQIPLPPLDIQKKIVEILDKAQSLIDQRKDQIKEMDSLVQSLFYDMFGDPVSNPKGWEVATLNEVCSKISVGFVGTCEPFYTTKENGVPMLRTGNLGEGFLKFSKMKYVLREFHQKQTKSQLLKGDILIARHGDNGKAVLYKGEFNEANCLNIVILRPYIELNSIFAQTLLNCKSTRRMIVSKAGGATQKVVNTKAIQKLNIIIPPISLQNTFAERVHKVEKQKDIMVKSLGEFEDNFNGLMQRAFRGELV